MRTHTWNRIAGNRIATQPMPGTRIRGAVDALLRFCGDALQRAKQRRDLSRLSDHSLRDIGLSRGQIRTEINTPFWRE